MTNNRRGRHRVSAKVGPGLLLVLSALLTGCTVTWDVAPKQPTSFTSQAIDLRVQLVLSKELREAKWEGKISPFDSAVIPLGEAIAVHSEHMARALFREVDVVEDRSSSGTSPVDATLTPKMISAQRTQPTTIFGDQTSTVILEWAFTDSNGQVLWVNTVTGQGQSTMGFNPESGAETQMAMVFQQLFRDCYRSIASSVEIKRFAESQ